MSPRARIKAMHRQLLRSIFVLAVVFAIAAPAAAHNRVEALAQQPIDFLHENESLDGSSIDNHELLRSALDSALPPSEPLASLAETRVRAFGDLAPFEREERSELTRALRQSYEQLNEKSASVESFCAGDPVNCSDPTGEVAHVSKSGVIIGIRPDNSRYRIEPGTDPVEALRILESDPEIRTGDEQEDLLTRAGIPVPFWSGPREGEKFWSNGKPNYRQYTHDPHGGRGDYFIGMVLPEDLPATTHEMAVGRGQAQIVRAGVTAIGVGYAGTKARREGGGRAGMPVEEFTAGRLRAQVPVDVVMDPLPDGQKRYQYMGNTPTKLSSTGVEVMVRMFNEGTLRVGAEGIEIRTQEGMWIPLRNTDMSHIEAAVTYWNREGYLTGPRSDEVYAFMRNPDNYILEQSSTNRARQTGETYRPPYKKR